MIALSGISVRFGPQVLFEDVAWQLKPGGHYGLVGANGAGKSTLLKVMQGEVTPDAGTVSRPNDLVLGVLGQDHFSLDDASLLDVVVRGRPRLASAMEEKAALLRDLEEGRADDLKAGERLAHLETVIADEEGYEAEAQAGALLSGLGMESSRHTRPMRELSGGYRLRVLLARTLFSRPGLLLLDEPTNHLDILSIRWLEAYLRAFRGTFVLISHDRHFLNAVCDTIADVDYQELRLYTGNYDAFEAAKLLSAEQKEAEIRKAEDKVEEMQRFIERFKAKATKARQAQSRKKQVERMEMPEIVRSSRRYPAFGFKQKRPSGREVLQVKGLDKSFGGTKVLNKVGFTLNRGERMAIVGPNGIGKSTLLKIICGRLESDGGEMVLGYEVHPGYFAQDHHEQLKGRGSVVNWLHDLSPGESVSTIRGILGRVLFSGDDVEKKISDLSGGESARLLLAGLMLMQDNLLILDEPTNHLDLEGREALMGALMEFEGTIMFVSHDRHFVSHVGTRVLALNPDGMEDFEGSYEEYLEKQGEDYLAEATLRQQAAGMKAQGGKHGGKHGGKNAGNGSGGNGADAKPSHEERKEAKRQASKLQKRVKSLEREVEQLEGRLQEMEQTFADPAFVENNNWEAMHAADRKQKALRKELEDKMAAWESAAAELEELGA